VREQSSISSVVVWHKQWRRNEYESGGTSTSQSRKKFLGVHLHFFGSKSTISRFGEHFRDGQLVQFGQFLVWCSSTHGAFVCAQPFVNVGARAPVPYGVGAAGQAGEVGPTQIDRLSACCHWRSVQTSNINNWYRWHKPYNGTNSSPIRSLPVAAMLKD